MGNCYEYIHTVVRDLQIVIMENLLHIFRNSEVFVSEYLENLEELQIKTLQNELWTRRSATD